MSNIIAFHSSSNMTSIHKSKNFNKLIRGHFGSKIKQIPEYGKSKLNGFHRDHSPAFPIPHFSSIGFFYQKAILTNFFTKPFIVFREYFL